MQMTNKELLRKKYLHIRKSLDKNRRNIAKINATLFLKEFLKDKVHILSFSSLEEEIDLVDLNDYLCKNNKLLLPTVDHTTNTLKIYKINSIKELKKSKTFNLLEPSFENPTKEIPIQDIDCVLVPGIVFNTKNHRIGFGKGFYDKFLNKNKALIKKTIGICFKETLIKEDLFENSFDVSVFKVLSF